MKKVHRIVLAFIFLTAINLHAQVPIDPGPGGSPGPKPIISRSIDGPSAVNCGDVVTYTFSPGIGIFCSSFKWTVTYPDGRSQNFSGQSIDIALGSTSGSMIIFVQAKSCNNSKEYNGGKTVDVGTIILRPSTFNGSAFLCNSASSSYTVSAVSGATSYTFSVPSGWKINGVLRTSFPTPSRTVTITAPSSGRGTAQIGVRANRDDVCGSANSSERIKTVTYGTQYPVITSSATTVGTNSFLTFNSRGLNVSNFTWQVPSGWTVVSGVNSAELIVITGNTSGNFQVEVSAQSCGTTVGNIVNINVGGGGGSGFFVTAEDSENSVDSVSLKSSLLSNEVSIYPNPAYDRLQLVVPEGGTKVASISIINLLDGKQVLYQKMNGNSSIDLSNIKDGFYMVNITNTNGKLIQKRIQVAH